MGGARGSAVRDPPSVFQVVKPTTHPKCCDLLRVMRNQQRRAFQTEAIHAAVRAPPGITDPGVADGGWWLYQGLGQTQWSVLCGD